MSVRPERWSDESIQTLVTLCQAGITKAAAAQTLGRSVSSVTAKARQLCLSFLREDSWTDNDIASLTELAADGYTSFEIGEKLGRSSSAVEGKARSYHIYLRSVSELAEKPMRYGDQWTCEDINILESHLGERCSVDELVPILGRSSKAIRSKMAVLGLRQTRNRVG